VNTPAAELLYTTIADLCQITPSSTLVDVCCGTGTIGLTLAKVWSRWLRDDHWLLADIIVLLSEFVHRTLTL